MNDTIFLFFYSLAHRSVFLDGVIVFFAFYFPFIVVFLAGLFLLFQQGILSSPNSFKELINKWKNFIPIGVSSILAWILAVFFKNLFHVPRPVLSLPDIYPLITKTTFSFPSEHAMFFSALAVSLYFYNKKIGYLFMFFALLIGVGRIASGVHFPLDILGGFLLGALVAYLVKKISQFF